MAAAGPTPQTGLRTPSPAIRSMVPDTGIGIGSRPFGSSFHMEPTPRPVMVLHGDRSTDGGSRESEKIKRGRPRKYGHDGSGGSGSSPQPRTVTPGSGSRSASGSGWNLTDPSQKRGEWAVSTAGRGFTPHVLKILEGEVPSVASSLLTMSTENPVPVSDQKKRALDALERRFAASKAELDQVDQFNCNPYSQKDLPNPSTPQLSSSQKDGENHPVYSELSEAVHEKLLQGCTMDPNRRDAVEKILIDIMRKGDESGGFVIGAKKIKKENWVLLDNFLPKDENSLTNARAKSLRRNSKRSRNHMSMKQHRQGGSYNFPEEFHNFERFKPMHAMWKEYICELVKDAGKKQLTEQLLTADLHGAFLSVVDSKTVSYVGIKGIMIRETTETFGVISQNSKFKVVPKAGSVFMLQADSWMVTLHGDMLSANGRSKKSIAQLRLQSLLR